MRWPHHLWAPCYVPLGGYAGSPALPVSADSPGGEITFYGSGLTAASLEHLLARCSTGAAAAAAEAQEKLAAAGCGPGRTAASLTAAELDAIRQAHRFDDLPEVGVGGLHAAVSVGCTCMHAWM